MLFGAEPIENTSSGRAWGRLGLCGSSPVTACGHFCSAQPRDWQHRSWTGTHSHAGEVGKSRSPWPAPCPGWGSARPSSVPCRGLPEERFWWPSQPLCSGARISISRRSGKPACCPASFRGTAPGAGRGRGMAPELIAGHPCGAGSGLAQVSVAVSLGLLSARLLDEARRHVLILALNPMPWREGLLPLGASGH